MPHMITDHALVRYMEHVNGIDIKKIKDSILTDEQIKIIKRGHAVNIKTHGVTLVCNYGKVITVMA